MKTGTAEQTDEDDIILLEEKYVKLFRCPRCKVVLLSQIAYVSHYEQFHYNNVALSGNGNGGDENNKGESLTKNNGSFQSVHDPFSQYKVSAVGKRGPAKKKAVADIEKNNNHVEMEVSNMDPQSSNRVPELIPPTPPSNNIEEQIQVPQSSNNLIEEEFPSLVPLVSSSPNKENNANIERPSRLFASVVKENALSSEREGATETAEMSARRQQKRRRKRNSGRGRKKKVETVSSIAISSFDMRSEEWPSLEETNNMQHIDLSDDGEHVSVFHGEPEDEDDANTKVDDNYSNVTLQPHDVKIAIEPLPPSPHKKLPRKYHEIITLSDSGDEDEEVSSSKRMKLSTAKRLSIKPRNKYKDLDSIIPIPEAAHGSHTLAKKSKNKKSSKVIDGSNSLKKNFSCEYCSKLFTRKRTLTAHIKGIHKDEYQSESQTQVSEPSPSVQNKMSHSVDLSQSQVEERVNSPSEDAERMIENEDLNGLFRCRWCDVTFTLLTDLHSHAINAHLSAKNS